MKMKREIPTEQVVTNSFKKKKRERRLVTMIGKPKPLVLEKAQEIQTGLNSNYPSFIKLMLRSHVSVSFWLKLPTAFCNPNLPKKDINLTLLDERGAEYTVKCLAPKFSLSGGWRRFSRAHKLAEGDALVFHLIEATKFKVYIVRARYLADADLACDLLNIDIPAQESVPGAKEGQIIKKCTGKYLRSHSAVPIPAESHPSVPLVNADQNNNLEQPETNATNRSPAENGAESHPSVPFLAQDYNSAEAMDTEVLEGVRLPEPIAGIQDFTILDSFTIIVNDMLIDPEISEDVRTKYYELCRSQKAYLHKHLMEGLNRKLVTEIISHMVAIADAVRASMLSTPEDTFKAWEKSLLVYKHLGMNVEFLLSRVGIHLQQALAFDYNGAVMEENRLKEEITARDAKIFELRNDSTRLQRELTTLMKGNREKLESDFQSRVNSP